MGEGFRARGVVKTYGATTALAGVTVEFGRGLNVIVGPNGSGKSTLMRVFLGLARPDRGEVSSLGLEPWRNRDRILLRVGVGFEGMNLPWWLSGVDALRIYSARRGASWSSVREYAEALGVDSYWGRAIGGYSMGMRKKLALVMAFSGAFDALVLDEPYTLLDSRSQGLVDSMVERLSRDIPVIVASHVMTEGLLKADTAAVMFEGRIVALEARGRARGVYLCEVSDLGKALESMASSAGHLRELRYSGGKLLYSAEEGIKLEGVRGCREILETLISYERALRGESM